MGDRKKLQPEIYVPRRRNGGGSSKGGTPTKTNEGKPPPVPHPNCCDDQEEEELDSPKEIGRSSEMTSDSLNWRLRDSPTSIATDLQGKLKVERRNVREDKIPVNHRTVSSRNHSKRENESNDDAGSQNGHDDFRSLNERLLDAFEQSNVPYIDSHCHTDFIFESFQRMKDQRDQISLPKWVEKFPAAFPKSFSGVIANFIMPDLFVNTSTNPSYDMDWVIDELQSNMYLGTTWGCHPHHVANWGKRGVFWTTLEHILQARSLYRVLAVGECGIDLHRCESRLEDQKMVFEKHVELAFKYNLPLVIHCRNGSKGYAEDDCLAILKKQMDKNHQYLKIHRHCFTEDWSVAQKWLKQCPDVHFGFTNVISTFSEAKIEAIRRIPLDRILLETDGPYFKPKVFEGIGPKVCLPGMAIATAWRIAEIKNLPFEEVLRATFNNTRRVYQIPVYDN